ncbi:endolytic transglycosylase MltG [Ignatzschineria indica]|uniref:endolytic transglycosylase MltG n=1 Tax=Ignatzschineria TaxID=112008 RepID=UPI000B991D25|nr:MULTISPECIES: endolytic transglycosylase MltG [Ignatzschineria]MDM1545436.1 endolytic transglycosylase MltG [Ignatzschineria indica]
MRLLGRVIQTFFRYLLSKVSVIIFLIILLGGFFVVSKDLEDFLQTPVNLPEDGIVLEIKPGMTIDDVVGILRSKNIIRNALYFKWYARFTGDASKLKVGEYALLPEMYPLELLSIITSGRVLQYNFTIIEGWNFSQLRQALEKSPHLNQTLKGLSNEEVMAAIGLEGKPYEGYFLPDTYLFPKNYSDAELLKRSYAAMNEVVDKAWATRQPNLPIKNKGELLTLASIVEKETGVASERPEIAGVFVRRLQKGMRLQTDPTVIYGLGDQYRGVIYKSDLQRDTPYNTYTRDGLPPTPIAMPSREAIYAAANPKPGKTLYFVAKGDGSGEHLFSETLDQHNRAVKQYRDRMRGK